MPLFEKNEAFKELFTSAFVPNVSYYMLEITNDIELALIRFYCSYLSFQDIEEKTVYIFASNGEMVWRCSYAELNYIHRCFRFASINRDKEEEIYSKIKINISKIQNIITKMEKMRIFELFDLGQLNNFKFYDRDGEIIKIGTLIKSVDSNRSLVYLGVGFYNIDTREVITSMNWFCFKKVKSGAVLCFFKKVKVLDSIDFTRLMNLAIVQNSLCSTWLNKMMYEWNKNSNKNTFEFYPRILQRDKNEPHSLKHGSDIR